MYTYWLKTFVIFMVSITSALAEEPDWRAYQAVLDHVSMATKNGVSMIEVDYPAIKNGGDLALAYRVLSTFDSKRLVTREEKLAFYINAYNILALKMVTDHWPVNSIKDIGSLFSPVWDKEAGQLAGEKVSLADVEHKILRKMGEPRIHMAIVCASVSCPDLRPEPYTAARLDRQLTEQSRNFLANPGKGLRIEQNSIRVSKIFDWFDEDFEVYGGVPAFIKKYRSDLPDLKIKANLPYDWEVNG